MANDKDFLGEVFSEPPKKKEPVVWIFKKTWKFESIGDLLRKLFLKGGSK